MNIAWKYFTNSREIIREIGTKFTKSKSQVHATLTTLINPGTSVNWRYQALEQVYFSSFIHAISYLHLTTAAVMHLLLGSWEESWLSLYGKKA
jgi:hypothetical protein